MFSGDFESAEEGPQNDFPGLYIIVYFESYSIGGCLWLVNGTGVKDDHLCDYQSRD